MRKVPRLETVFRDYSPKGVKFFYIYKSLAHPEYYEDVVARIYELRGEQVHMPFDIDTYVEPYTLDERLMHVREAKKRLGTEIPWIVDDMDNRLKHALGDMSNSEFVIDEQGVIRRKRAWSDPEALRSDLIELVGAVENPTTVEELGMKFVAPPQTVARGVIPRLDLPKGLKPLRVRPAKSAGGAPFYAKLRAEAYPDFLEGGRGQIYLGFRLDPIYPGVHWNNLVAPLHFEIDAPPGVRIEPISGRGPKLKVASDADPREFLLEAMASNFDQPLLVTASYYACNDDEGWCKPIRQSYAVDLEVDRDGGSAIRKAEYFVDDPTVKKSSDSDLAQKLDRELARVLSDSPAPGLAVGVVRNQKLVYAKGFGLSNVETGAKVSTRTLFHMASVTKPFVATAIVQLLEQQKLSLDDRIVKHLPYFKMADDRYSTLTIRQLVTHSSGMPDVEDYHWDEPEYDEGALGRFVRSLDNRELLFEPGEKFTYSNIGFEILGDLIAKVSGRSFADYVKENILLPLGMNDSSILIRDVDPTLLARGHVQGEDEKTQITEHYAYNRRHGPSSTLHSNVVNMSRWAMANMNGGELEGTRILKSSSYKLLWTPSVEVERGDRSVNVGLSWFLSERDGHQTVSHSGGDTGYGTYFVMVPDAGVAVIVLSNYSGPESPVGEVTRLALELALDSE